MKKRKLKKTKKHGAQHAQFHLLGHKNKVIPKL